MARRPFRSGSAALRTLELLSSYPLLTASRLAALLEVSFPAATRLGQLIEVGNLQEKTGYRHNRVFVAPDVITVVNRPFGEEPLVEQG